MNEGLTRRSFLVGTVGLTTAVVGATWWQLRQSPEETGPLLVPLFSADRVIAAGQPQRIPFAIVNTNETASLDDEDTISVVITQQGTSVGSADVAGHIVQHDHVEGTDPDHQHTRLFRYYPLRTTLPEPGIYDLNVSLGSHHATLPVQAFRPDELTILRPGETMPSLKTATFDNWQDVDTLCTRFEEPCPFHTLSVDEALTSGQPTAVLVATPALCATAYCGPVVEQLASVATDHPGINFIHLEPYANPAEVDNNYADPAIKLAQPVIELGLEFEPALFLVNAEHVLVDRIDNLFDTTELRQALARLAS